MAKKRALIMFRMDPPLGKEAQWNEWYNHEHIPKRLALPRFLAIRRFEVTEGLPEKFVVPGPKYLTLYELADIDALHSKAYLSLQKKESSLPTDSFQAMMRTLPNLSGGVYEQIFPEEGVYKIPEPARFLLAVGHGDLPRDIEDEYNAWYNTEHIPSYSEVPGFLSARRFRAAQGKFSVMFGDKISGPQYTAFYDLADDKVFETESFKERSVTPWSARIRSFTWSRRKMNNLYRCIFIAKR